MPEGEAKTYEVRRSMKDGGWAVFARTPDKYEAAEIAGRLQQAVRSKGAFVDVVEVAR